MTLVSLDDFMHAVRFVLCPAHEKGVGWEDWVNGTVQFRSSRGTVDRKVLGISIVVSVRDSRREGELVVIAAV